MPEPNSKSVESSAQLAADQPTRGAQRNRETLTDDRGSIDDDFLLPSLDSGLTLLDIDGGRGVQVLQSLVLDHLLLESGPAFWVDAHGFATTTSLARISPSQRLLNRIHVARGFTPYQHFSALWDLPSAVNGHIRENASMQPFDSVHRQQDRLHDTAESSSLSPSLIVVPALDVFYRDDSLPGEDGKTLLSRGLARLKSYADGYDAPILLTRSVVDEFTAPVERAVDHHLECKQTAMGPRFMGEEFETLVYPIGNGQYQTTLAYWCQVLSERAKQVELQPASPSEPETGATKVGDATMADGSTATLSPSPLHDALTTGAGW